VGAAPQNRPLVNTESRVNRSAVIALTSDTFWQ
jgi:hypothetical protein